MTVCLTDKRRPKERIHGVGMPNDYWFKVLDIKGMDKLLNTQHTNDPLNVTPSKAKKIANLIIENRSLVDMPGENNEWVETLIWFLDECNGFRSH